MTIYLVHEHYDNCEHYEEAYEGDKVVGAFDTREKAEKAINDICEANVKSHTRQDFNDEDYWEREFVVEEVPEDYPEKEFHKNLRGKIIWYKEVNNYSRVQITISQYKEGDEDWKYGHLTTDLFGYYIQEIELR